jgi:hypothetical protein
MIDRHLWSKKDYDFFGRLNGKSSFMSYIWEKLPNGIGKNHRTELGKITEQNWEK